MYVMMWFLLSFPRLITCVNKKSNYCIKFRWISDAAEAAGFLPGFSQRIAKERLHTGGTGVWYKVLVVRRFPTYYISKSSIALVWWLDKRLFARVRLSDRPERVGRLSQGWNRTERWTPMVSGGAFRVTKRRGKERDRTKDRGDGVRRVQEAFTFEHGSSRGCRRCPRRKWKQIARPRKSPHKCTAVRT